MFESLKQKLSRTREILREKYSELLKSEKQQQQILAELEEVLLLADVGIASTGRIIQSLQACSKKNDDFQSIGKLLKKELVRILSQYPSRFAIESSPAVVMMVGVNGGGKTTSMAKLASRLKKGGKRTLMVAADTFRAAAQEQLSIWGKKLNIPVVKGQYGSDPAAVVYDGIQSLKAHGYEILLVDTAGRIHTNTNLMKELEKVRRIISREIEGAPQETLLVLDASVGQNALRQAREFLKFSGITGIFLTKLDGTAKGGSVISVVDELELPIKFIGVGETADDLLEFSPSEFVDALLS